MADEDQRDRRDNGDVEGFIPPHGGYLNAPLLWTGVINPFVDTIAHPTDVTRYYEWTG